LVWATYYGSNEVFNAITTDTQDNVYITGYSYPIYFPTQQLTGAYFQANHTCMQDAVILKFNHQGQRLWATFYGGAGEDEATSICADSQNNIYIVGVTGTEDFPTQYLAGSYNQDTLSTVSNSYRTDGFILKFNYSGQRQWATYYGGMDSERGLVICRDSQDNIYIAGNTFSWNLPVQQLTGAYWHMIDLNYYGWDLFILKFNSQGQRVWATYYGDKQVASKISICADSQDNIYIAGTTGSIYFPCQQLTNAYWQPDNILGDDAFIIKFNSQCILKWASCYGGVSDVYANSICADKQDNIYITGNTNLSYLSDFPTQYLATAYWQANSSGYEDIFILKFNNQGVRQWATYYGGSDFDIASSICADNQNNIYITGETYSSDFPVQQLVGTYNQSTSSVAPYDNDVFILKFNSQGQRLWATYYGSNGRDKGYGIAVDSQNSVYFTGNFQKSGAYTVDYGNGAFYNNGSNSDDDGFILKFIFSNQVIAAWLAFNEVAANGKWCASKCKERHFQFSREHAHGF
jgi:hypothetical protein